MIDNLLIRLADARARLRRTQLISGLLLVLATLVAAVFAWFVCDWLFVHRILEGGWWDRILRGLLLLGVLGVAGWMAYRTVIAEWRIERSDDDLAVRVERANQSLGGRLISAVQLARVDDQAAMAPDLIEGLIEATVAEAEAIDFRTIIDLSGLKRAALWALAALVVVGGLSAWKPTYAVAAGKRLLLTDTEYPTATRILAITPLPAAGANGTLVQAQGDPLNFIVDLDPNGYLPAEAEVVVKPQSGRQSSIRLLRDEQVPTRYKGSLPQVLDNLQFRPYAFDARWPSWIAVEALRRPQIKSLTATVTYPAYLGQAPETVTLTDLALPVGATLKLTAEFAEPVTKAELESVTGTADPVLVPCTIDAKGTSATLEMPVTATTSLRVLLNDSHGLTNPDPVSNTITAIPDTAPAVALTYPPRDVSATRFARWPLKFSAKDDHALGKAAIRWQIEDATGEAQTIELGDIGPDQQVQKESLLEMSKINAPVGARVVFWIEVRDRKQPEANLGSSLKRTVTILDPEQLRLELEEARAAAVEAISTARDRQKEIKAGVDQLIKSPEAKP